MKSAGTVRCNRKNLPNADVPADKDMERGEVAAFEASGVHYVKWKDNKGVHMLSNFLTAQPLQKVQRRKKGSSTKDDVSCPNVVKLYNDHMGGVDIMDQKKSTYQFDHRSKVKYYLRVIFDLLDISINNAFVIYMKSYNEKEGLEKMDSKTFRRIIARSLIGNYTSRKRNISLASISTSSKRAKYGQTSVVRHTLEKVGTRQRCKLCTSNKIQNRTNNKCVECNIYLCFVKDRDCFKLYHDCFQTVSQR